MSDALVVRPAPRQNTAAATPLGAIAARTLLVGLMIVTLMPFVAMLSAALAPSGSSLRTWTACCCRA